MHGYYIHYRDINDPATLSGGSDKKVKAQIKAFNNAGLNCEFLFCPHPEDFLGMVKSCLPFFSDGVKWPNPNTLKDADYLYIRRPRFFSADFVCFLQELKKVNPKILVICEIPTYPYDKEMKRPKVFLAYLKDKKYRKRLNGLVDYFADLSNKDSIFGIKTVPFINGIDLDSVYVKRNLSNPDTLNLVSVAYFEFWHGLDRVIEGMHDYYCNGGQRNIHLHVIGDGGEIPNLKKLVSKHELEDKVIFYGSLMPYEMDPIYDMCQFGISELGAHRRDPNAVSSSLKSREYLAKGLPFAHSSKVDVFEKHPNDFCLEFPATDDPIDITKLLDKYDEIHSRYSDAGLISKIRNYAEENIAINVTMKKVVDIIKSRNQQETR